MEKYDMEKMLSAVEKYKVSYLYVVPPIVKQLVKQPEVVNKYDVSSVKEIGSAAAPLGKDMMEECAKIFPKAAVNQYYGLTETCAGISMEDRNVGSRNSGSTGALLSGIESKIIDVESLKPLPPFQKGEIWVRGPIVMKGRVLRDNTEKLSQLGVKNNAKILASKVPVIDQDGKSVKDEFLAEEERSKMLSRLRLISEITGGFTAIKYDKGSNGYKM